MDVTFPDEPSISGMFLKSWRRRLGSVVEAGNIEEVITIIVKQAYTITPSDTDPALGSLSPDDNGPGIFETDQPGAFLDNGDFEDGLAGWTQTGGANATASNAEVILNRNGGSGDLRQSAGFGRQVRHRGIGFSVKASASEGLSLPQMSLVTGTQTVTDNDPGGSFPASNQQPVTISGYAEFGDNSATAVSTRLDTMGADGQTVTYSEASVTAIEYESDLVPFKPEADLIVIADAPPAPVRVEVDGIVRLTQEAEPVPTLTGLGWEPRFGTAREGEGGAFVPAPTEPLPNTFENRYFNGYSRSFSQGGNQPYPAPAAQIRITDADGNLYAFTLPDAEPVATHSWYTGNGVDDPCLWRRRRLVMSLDTLVIETDRNEAYAVWRTTWPVGSDADGTGPVPFDANRAVSVEWEGV